MSIRRLIHVSVVLAVGGEVIAGDTDGRRDGAMEGKSGCRTDGMDVGSNDGKIMGYVEGIFEGDGVGIVDGKTDGDADSGEDDFNVCVIAFDNLFSLSLILLSYIRERSLY